MKESVHLEALEHPFIVGIDLGTTNCAVAFVDLRSGEGQKPPEIRIFDIPQLTHESEIRRLPMLPSFLYIPGTYEISKNAIMLPWGTQSDNFVGYFAREQGVKVPSRLVSSAKSWLCNDKVDRKAKILPWGDEKDIPRVSPVTASAAYLDHIRKAWNDFHQDEDLYLENQKVIVTVPASFDEAARDLTLESARLAGLKNVVLLEEPLAAFYSWLVQHEKDWQDHVQTHDLILVCDVGGGTTDFTLIALKEIDGHPGFERIAVGDHLILGGDNIDIEIARKIELQASRSGTRLSLDRWKSLCNQCRQAKEDILNHEVESKRITLVGQGSRLIAGTISAPLTLKEVEEVVLNTFFPLPEGMEGKETDISPDTQKQISEFGLPYESETAVTRHLIRFIKRNEQEINRVLNKNDWRPDFILFNGGSLKPKILQERIIQSIAQGADSPPGKSVRVLENTSFDLAVARGAAYYGLVKIGQGVRVGSGSPRSYYLGVADKAPENRTRKAICLVERGIEEGSKIELKQKEFTVLANQPVAFEIFSSSFRSGDRSGSIIEVDSSLTRLPSLHTVIQFGKKGSKTEIPIHLEAEYTEVGTLAVWCRSLVSPHSWRLQFDLRNTKPVLDVGDESVLESESIEKVGEFVAAAFSGASSKSRLDALIKDIATEIGEKKEDWPLSLIRSVSDVLLENQNSRKISPDHEARWLNLLGYCLRPGFGDGFDDHRIKKLWKIYSQGPVKANNSQVRMEWWILWRRVAGGLTSGFQQQFVQDTGRLIFSKKGAAKKLSDQERLEVYMAVANMERIDVEHKLRWGNHLISEINIKKTKSQQLWCMSRFGARDLLYGSTDRVVPVKDALQWMYFLMNAEWKNPGPVVQAVVQMARKTGDRLRDIPEPDLEPIKQWIARMSPDRQVLDLLDAHRPTEKQDQTAIFGESLPMGLVISKDSEEMI